MDNKSILLGLHELKGIGWETIEKLIIKTQNLVELLEWGDMEWREAGIRRDRVESIRRGLTQERLASRLEWYRKENIHVLTLYDEAYPYRLRHSSRPPWVLYAKGNLKLLENHHSLAIVGSRTPTAYGRRAATELAYHLSEAGLSIVSGLARGIDSAAHLGALEGKAKTIAILGTSIDRVYPPENLKLFKRIEEEGVVLSEYFPGIIHHPGLFPLRNRVIAGISLGTLVVEAAQNSGSLITADMALDESRDLFAVPGPIFSPKSRGTNELLQTRAKMVVCANDVLEEYKGFFNIKNVLHPADSPKPEPELTKEERRILGLISFEPTTIDYLLEQSETNFGHLHTILLSLLMKKKIAQHAGSAYVLI
ncbi:DNA-processing protein DprA [Paenibacillus residui]|uniref:DNA-processing protein DprA n=1 Tax=Paenibacillus residui TaxID=629724 RepID=A0ABW3D9G5_9BACL